MPSASFFAVEVTAYKPGTTTLTVNEGHGAHPHGALADFADSIQETGTLLASDVGYRTAPSDPGGPIPYPPLLSDAFQISSTLNLDPAQSGAAASWGTMSLANPRNQFDSLAAAWSSDGWPVVVRWGTKGWDAARGYRTDPSYSTLLPAFAGLAAPWFLTDTALTIPLRDATYWLDRPLQGNLYLGTGTYEGPAALAGVPKPKTRGGTSSHPVCNVTPTLMDPTNRIYQYNDGPGTVVGLFEGAAAVFTYGGDTTDLYSGSTSAGQYRTDNSRGLFQLGSAPVHAITADVTGQFPSAGVVTTFAAIARYLLSEDMSLPAANLDTASFTATDTAYPYTAGLYFDSGQAYTGVDAISAALSGLGAKLVPFRDGTLRMLMLRALPGTALPVASYDETSIVSLIPQPLPDTLAPPPFRMRVGYNHSFTVQTSDLNAGSATAARLQFVAAADRFAAWSSNDVLLAYKRPNDPPPLPAPLLVQADAQSVVNDLGALLGVRRRLYSIVVPIGIAMAREHGHIVSLTYPADDLSRGRLGQIVGYTFNATDPTATLQVLV